MTIRAVSKFTPEVLLSSPRRSPGVPNSNGSKILYSVTSYSFETRETTSEVRLLDVATSESDLVSDDSKVTNPVWVHDGTIALLRTNEEEATEIVVGPPAPKAKFEAESYVVSKVEGPASDLKITKLGTDSYGIALVAAANPDGSIYSPKHAEKNPRSSGKLYRSLFVRHWDKWITPQRKAIWYGALFRQGKSESEGAEDTRQYFMSPLVNSLRHTRLESPIPPFGGSDQFDISKRGLIFTAKDPDLNPALHSKCNIYFVPLSNFLETTPPIYTFKISSFNGAISSPVFSRDGRKAAWLMMREDGNESDKNQIFMMPNTETPGYILPVLASDDQIGQWELSPSSVTFSHDGRKLFLTAEWIGRKRLYSLDPLGAGLPQELAYFASVDNVQPLSGKEFSSYDRLFLSGTTLTESSLYAIMQIRSKGPGSKAEEEETEVTKVSAFSQNGARLGLHESQIGEMWSHCAGVNPWTKDMVHSWIIRPSNFDSSKKYPLAFLVHGGPQGAWTDSWSTRWNPAVFAEQGYVVIAPNPTGSTGYGQYFTDAIQESWGGLPYEDLVKCFEHIEKHLDYVDTDRAVALGASYGGYMMNWIQGHPLGRKFRALVTHDGVFSTVYELATEELYFVNRDFGGWWANNRGKWLKWDPSQFAQNWKTPHLIIHSEKDYRLTMADGLGAFNVLQTQGVESEFLTFPDENHFVLKPENSLVWHETVFNWINKHVGLPLYKKHDDKGIIQDPTRPESESESESNKSRVQVLPAKSS